MENEEIDNLIKELKEIEILSIKSIDLRNNKKAIINFNK